MNIGNDVLEADVLVIGFGKGTNLSEGTTSHKRQRCRRSAH